MLLSKEEILNKFVINHDKRKCFIFDLDGTIIFNKKFLDINIDKILKDIKSRGHEVIFATGRPFRDFQTVMPSWTYNNCLVLFSGALSMHQQNIIDSVFIPAHNVVDLVNLCIKNNIHYNIDNSHNYYHPDLFHDFYHTLDETVGMYKATHLDQVFDGTTHKILVLDASLEEMFSEYTNENNLSVKRHSYDKWFDIVPIGVNKHKAVLPFIKEFDVDDVFVFGNDYNDYELLLNFKNSTLFGDIVSLKNIAALNIKYDEHRQANFELLINTILS